MTELSVTKFRSNIKTFVDRAIDFHEVLRIKRRKDRDFVIISAEDWDREQETLFVLQNTSLMNQIKDSVKTHQAGKGYQPTEKELNEINSI